MKELLRVRDRYQKKAEKLSRIGGDYRAEILETAAFYLKSAEAVDRLIVLGNCRTI